MRIEGTVGSPGTGKTATIINNAQSELGRGVPPHKICYVSFTRKAAEEAVTRACDKFGFTRAQLPWFRTLHSLCFRWLGLRPEGVLAGAGALRKFGRWAGLDVSGTSGADEGASGHSRGDRVLHMINLARVRCRILREQYDEDDDGLPWNEVDHAARALERYKETNGLVDYTDMLEQFAAAAPRMGFEVVFGDEVQDNSLLNWRAFDQLCHGARRVMVAGDDDQAIYEWAGASAAYFVDLDCDIRVLGQSYRVPRKIQALALDIISPVRHRRPKTWAPRDEAGEIVHVNSFDEADTDGPSVLVLARNRYVLEEQAIPVLRSRGIVYEYRGEPSVRPEILEAVEAWERLRAGGTILGREALGLLRYITVGRGRGPLPAAIDPEAAVAMADMRALGQVTTGAIWHEALDRLPPEPAAYMLAARRAGERLRGAPRVRLSTIHGSKGGQADHVIVFQEMAKRTYQEYEKWPDAERRVWYVAVTRAKQRLTLVAPRTGQFFRL